MRKSILFVGAVIVVLISGFFAFNQYIYDQKQTKSSGDIASFKDCVNAGFPVLESYPEQCVTSDNKRFVKSLSEDELSKLETVVELRGKLICLPHWDTEGPQTLECAMGFQDEEGRYYLIQNNTPNSDVVNSVGMETMVQVKGQLVPGSSASYQSVGTIKVNEIVQIER